MKQDDEVRRKVVNYKDYARESYEAYSPHTPIINPIGHCNVVSTVPH